MPHRKVSIQLDVKPGPTDHVRKAFEQIQHDMARGVRMHPPHGSGSHGPGTGPLDSSSSPMTEMGRALERLASGPIHIVAEGLSSLASSIDELADSLGAGGLLFTGIRDLVQEMPIRALSGIANLAAGSTNLRPLTQPGSPGGFGMDRPDATPIGGGPPVMEQEGDKLRFVSGDLSQVKPAWAEVIQKPLSPLDDSFKRLASLLTGIGPDIDVYFTGPLNGMKQSLENVGPSMRGAFERRSGFRTLEWRPSDAGPGVWDEPGRGFYRSMFPNASPRSRGNPEQLKLSALTDNTRALNEVTFAVRDLVFEMRGGIWGSLPKGGTGDEAFFPMPKRDDRGGQFALDSGLDNNYWGSSLGLSGNH
jgi:hypothetical protein